MSADFAASLPFAGAAPRYLADAQLRANLRQATTTIREKRNRLVKELDDFEELRASAAAIKDEAQSRLDQLLVQLEGAVTRAGGHVHFAANAQEANDIVVGLVQRAGAAEVVKVKSMTTAETRLNQALDRAGINVTETDLAELIVQLGNDLPSHIVVPAIHRNRSEIRDIFAQRMGEHGLAAPKDLTDEPAALAAAARAHLRQRFFRAGVAISGANFVIADSGALVVVESEGNGRMCLTLPQTLISVVGIDKVVPTFADLEVYLQLLARSATGERMNPYTSVWRGVTPGDGPQDFHLVLLDNGRSSALADRVGRQALRCIRCAACLNVCPVYERVGGHAYGSVYPGPIGAVLTPQLDGVASDPVAASLPFASTLCGACYEVCPVRIDIPRLLVHLRARTVDEAQQRGPTAESVTMAAAGVVLSSPKRLALVERLAGRLIPPWFPRGTIGPMPGPLGRWTRARDAPVPARQSFRDWWQAEHPLSGEAGALTSPGHPGPSAAPLPALGLGHLLKALLPPGLQPKPHRSAASRPAPISVAKRTGAAPGAPGPSSGPLGRAGVLASVQRSLAAAPFPAMDVPRSYRRAGQSGVEDSVALFVQRVSEYRAGAVVVGRDQVASAVAEALAGRASKRLVVAADLPPSWLPDGDDIEVQRDNAALKAEELEQFDAAVTGCTVAIAGTGTIVLGSGPAQGRRALSLVPDHLVVVVLADQVVGGVPDAVAVLGDQRLQTWISGPSATSDIELNRVEGVHGPRVLDVVVVTGPGPT